jgi:translocation and assembly module TamB
MRALRIAGVLVGTAAIFVLSAAFAVVLHLGTPRARRVVAQAANEILAPSFQGRITIDRLGALGLFGLSGAEATVDDPSGRPVLELHGARVSLSTLAALHSAVLGRRGPLTIRLPEVSIDSLDVRLDADPSGKLALLSAFEPRKASTPPDPNARGVRLVLARIVLRHAWVRGQMSGGPPIDADLDGLRGAFTYAPELIEGELSQVRIVGRGIANGADLEGLLGAHVKKRSDPNASVEARASWQGSVGGIPHAVHASLADRRLDAVVDVPEVLPNAVRALWPSSPIEGVARVHAEAHGSLPSVDIDLDAALAHTTFRARARTVLGDEKTADISFLARDLDVHELAASAPRSHLGLTGDLSATMKADGALVGNADVHFLGGHLGSHAVPPASIRAVASGPRVKELHGHAEVVVEEPSAPTRLSIHLLPHGKSSALEFAVDADIADFDRVPQLQHALRGSCRLAAKGSVDITSMMLDASLEAAAADIVQGATTVRSAAIDAHARGALAAPIIDVALHSKDAVAAKRHFASLDVHATGRAGAPHVKASAHGPDIPDIDAAADVGLGSGISFEGLRVAMARLRDQVLITADRVQIAGGDVRAENARIEGLGAPASLTLSRTSRALRLRASTQGVDLGRVGRLLQVEKSLEGGMLAFDVDVDLRTNDAYGWGTVELTGAGMAGVKDISARVRAELDGRKFAGNAQAKAAGVGSIEVDAPKLALGGAGALSMAAWKRAWGDVDIDARVDLGKIESLIPAEQFPLSEARGDIILRGHLARDDMDDLTPDARVSLVTNHLIVAPKTPMTRDIDGVLVMPPPRWRLAGVDFNVDASIDGDTGFMEISTQLRDAKGELARVNASAPHVPYVDILRDTGRFSSDVRTMPFELHLQVPERGLGGLPDLLKQRYVTGKLSSNLTVKGTILHPKVELSALLHKSRIEGTARSLALEFELAANYEGTHGKASIKGRAEGRELIDAETQFEGSVAQLLDSGGSEKPWQASARAHFADFPLEAIGMLDDKMISGQLSGDLSLADLHRDARAEAELSVDSLRIGSVGYKSARLAAKADGHVVDATARIDQDDGFAETRARAAATWGAKLAPALEPAQPLEVALSSKNFRIAGLLPFVDRWLDELDGRLDADTHLELDPGSRRARLAGSMAISRGTFELTAGGGDFQDLGAKVNFSPDGVVTLEKLSAAGMTGRVEATGSARLDGMGLQSARAVVVIPGDSPIPLSTGGSEIGNIDGRVEASEVTSEGGKVMNVTVEVPHVRLALPEGSSRHAMDLRGFDKVRIGAHRGQQLTFVLLPLDPVKKADETSGPSGTRLDIQTRLRDVQVVRGSDLKVDLTGNLDVKVAGSAQVTGAIQLKPGGVLVVQGRRFVVENGTVTFVGDDPSNPQVVVKAGWTASDGTVVYANFVGPLKTGKVTLTSEPTLPQQEIVQLLLFGTTGGKPVGASSGGPDATTALGTVGSEAAQPINHALGQLGLGAVTTKVDTSESATPKPEVEVQIARDISIQIAVVLGQPPPGVNPDRTLLTLDWRFLSRWSLSSTLGDAGTAIFDVLWQRRY